MQIQNIPLNELHPSPKNVRKTSSKTIADLAASIASMNLLQNLNVERVSNGYEVVSGGRRLMAMRQLVADGKLADDFPVPCMVVDGDTATEVSTAENVIREQMHPADEFVAFNELVLAGKSTLEIAARFGCDEAHVNRMLRLANVSPQILDLFRQDDGAIELEQVMALAITDDHDAQEKAWAAAKTTWQREPSALRKQLTKKELSVDSDPVAKYVGADAYRDAGGEVRKDLFESDGTGEYMVDVKLARRLAEQMLKKRAEQVAKDGWLWVEARIDFSQEDRRKFSEAPYTWKGSKRQWADADKKYSGAVVSLDGLGKVEVHGGLVRPGDKKKYGTPAAKKTATKAAKPTDGLPFTVVQRLQGQRTAVLRLHMAKNHRFAVAALAAALWQYSLGDEVDELVRIGTKFDHYNHRPDRIVSDAINDSPESEELEKLYGPLDRRYHESKADSILAWLLSEPIETSLEVLALAAADALLCADKTKPAKHDAGPDFAALAGVNMGEHWKVDADWLSTLPKRSMLRALREAGSKADAARIEKLKGDDQLEQAAALLQAKGWLPAPLRAPAPKKGPDAKQKAAGDVGR